MNYRPGDAVYVEFVTSVFATGAASNADSLPTGTVNKNGTDDGAVTVTVTNIDAGRYKATFTIPDTYLLGDVMNLTIAATVSSVAGKGAVWHAILQGPGVIRYSKATAGGANTVTLDAAASATDNFYLGAEFFIYGGTGAGQAGLRCTGYVGSTKVATLERNWITNPASASLIAIRSNPGAKTDVNLRADVGFVAGTSQTARDLGLALPAAAPQAAGGLVTSAAGSLDFDDLAADADNIETLIGTPLHGSVVGDIDSFRTAQTSANTTLLTDITAVQTRVTTALPALAPQEPGGLIISVAGSLDMDDMAADVDAAETRVTLALPAAAPGAPGGLPISTAGSLDLDELNTDVEAIQTRVELALPAVAAGANGGLPLGDASGRVAVATVATDAVNAAALATDAVTEIVAAVWAAAARTLTASLDPTLAAIAAQIISDHGTGSYVDTGPGGDATLANQTTLLGRLTSGRATNLDNLDAAVSTRLATSGYTVPPTVGAIDTQLTGSHGAGAWTGGGGGGGGTGANTVTVTVTDGTNPVQNATVRATLGITTNLLTTDVDGEVVFLLDDGTWALAATAPGYQGASDTLAVSGDDTATLALTLVVIVPPADPLKATVYTNAYAPGVTVTFTLLVTPTPDGHIYDATPVTGTAAGDGLLTADLYRGGRYQAYQGARLLGVVDVPDADTYELPDWLGGA